MPKRTRTPITAASSAAVSRGAAPWSAIQIRAASLPKVSAIASADAREMGITRAARRTARDTHPRYQAAKAAKLIVNGVER